MGRKPGPKCLKEPLLPSAMFCLSAGPCYFAEWGSDIVSGVRIMGEAMDCGEEAGQSVRFGGATRARGPTKEPLQ